MARLTNALTSAQYQSLITGLPKYCPNAVFVIDGQSYTTAQVVALVQTVVTTSSAVAPAEGALKAARSAVAAAQAKEGVVIKGVREIVALQFKSATATLADLGISPRKTPAPLSAAARAAAEAKSKATRIARGTKGKKEKLGVTGNVTGVTIVPVTIPAPGAAAGSTPVASSGGTAGGSAVPAGSTSTAGGGALHA